MGSNEIKDARLREMEHDSYALQPLPTFDRAPGLDEVFKRGLTYKPGWFIQYSTVGVIIHASVPNTYDLTGRRTLNLSAPIHRRDAQTVPRVMNVIRNAVWYMEAHEVQEWLKLGGRPYYDPHGVHMDGGVGDILVAPESPWYMRVDP